MYDLGKQFKFDLDKSTANKECIFRGAKYRITILTERLVRLEYNIKGIFEDYPTELIWYRNFPKPEFVVNETNSVLNIKTKYFELNYIKNKKFYGGKLAPTRNLRIDLLNAEKKVWYYKHPEARNYETSVFEINDTKSRKIARGLYSIDGFASIDDSKTSIVLENGSFKRRDNSGIDVYVFLYNKDFYFCLNDYFMLTGYPPMIPRYALGNWWSKDDSYNEIEIGKIVKKFEENNFPISLFVLNNWQNGEEFTFNKLYTDPKSIPNYLHNKNVKLGLSLDIPSKIQKDSKTFEQLREYVPQDKDGNISLNAFDARTIDAFLKLMVHPLDNIGVDFYSINNFNIKELEKLSILKHYLFYDALRNKKRGLITSRNFTYASHRYPILYAGKSEVSWNTLKKIPSFNAKATNLGISFWSHDAGGSTGGIEDNELFTRFIQLCTFSPILRLGSDSGKYYKREPWKWGLKTREITKTFLNLRYKLIPYLYTEAYKYHKYGKPLIEPIYYNYPALYDSNLYKDEYFLGSTLFVCPIVNKKNYLMNRTIHKIFLPEGVWYDFFTGKKYKGNRKYVSFYRDQEYPVFVKAGSIIPISMNLGNNTNVPRDMEIRVFPGDNNTYSIYEDDGETENYLNTNYLITNVEFIYEKDHYQLTILPVGGKKGIIPEYRNYRIRFKDTKPTSKVSSFISGKRIDNNCYKDDTDLVVDVKNVPTSSQLTVICMGQDIEIDAIRIISEDIVSIISDLPIKTVVKQKIDDIMFNSSMDAKKKRIEIRKLAHGKDYLERKYIDLLLKLLEYINEV